MVLLEVVINSGVKGLITRGAIRHRINNWKRLLTNSNTIDLATW